MKLLAIPLLFSLATPLLANDFMQFYRQGRFSLCTIDIDKNVLPKRSLNDTEEMIYAECLFQSRRYSEAASVLAKVLKRDRANQTRAANRMLDILKIGEKDLDLTYLLNYLEKQKSAQFIAIQLQPLLIEKGRMAEFLRMYRKYPTYLNRQQWSQLAAGLDGKNFSMVVNKAALPALRKRVLQAQFKATHGDDKGAIGDLDQIISERPEPEAVKLRASIMLRTGKREQALASLEVLKKGGGSGYRDLAGFLFENGMSRKALATVREAINKGQRLYDLEIFYLMARMDLTNSAYLLEKYRKEKKIQQYRYHSLKQDYMQQGTRQDYFKGLQRFAVDHPGECPLIIENQVSWDTDENIIKEIKGCAAIKKTGRWKGLLFDLDNRKKHDLVFKILLPLKSRSTAEDFLMAKSLLLKNKANVNRSISKFRTVLKKKDLAHGKEARYFLGKALLEARKFPEAEKQLSSIQYRDSQLVWLQLLVYRAKWKELQIILKTVPLKGHEREKKYFSALWSLSQNQLKQAETLFESYLQDAVIYGNESVYYLFLLKYFKQDKALFTLLSGMLKYPLGSTGKDWDAAESMLEKKPGTELAAFTHYWHARHLMLNSSEKEGIDRLVQLRKSENAALLYRDIDYLLLGHSSDKSGASRRQYLLKFPDSPFNILLKP